MRELSISVSDEHTVSGLLEIPKGATCLLVLAHGAGAGMRHPGMQALAEALHAESLATLRFQFPYMQRDSKRPDSPEVAMNTIAAAVNAASKVRPKLPIFAGGRSFGGRMTTHAAAAGKIPEVLGIVCFAFPLHPAKKPGLGRAAHLSEVPVPFLFLQGTRDDLSDLKLMKKVAVAHPRRLKLHLLEGADHSFAVLKSSGRTNAQVLEEVAKTASTFCNRICAKSL